MSSAQLLLPSSIFNADMTLGNTIYLKIKIQSKSGAQAKLEFFFATPRAIIRLLIDLMFRCPWCVRVEGVLEFYTSEGTSAVYTLRFD